MAMPSRPLPSAERARAALLADQPVTDDDLVALVEARLAGRSWGAEALPAARPAPAPERTEPVRYRQARPLVAAMTRRRRAGGGDDRAPVVRDADPAELAAEEERQRLPPGKLPPGLPVEAKRRKGLGGYRSAVIEEDGGGRKLKVRIGSEVVEVQRDHVRAPREARAPRRALVALAPPPAGAPLVLAREGRARGQPLPKPRGRLRDGDYLSFVRRQPCLSCGTRQGVQAHHHGRRPVGRKADDYCTVPLCARCHSHLHTHGWLINLPGISKPGVAAFLAESQRDLLILYFVTDADGETIEEIPAAEHLLIEALSGTGPVEHIPEAT